MQNPKLAGLNDHMVGQFVRVIVAAALQLMANVIGKPSVWAFSLAADATTHFGVSMLDQRIRVCFNGVLVILHLVLVPFHQRHTAVNYVHLITTKTRLHASFIARQTAFNRSDGENSMTG